MSQQKICRVCKKHTTIEPIVARDYFLGTREKFNYLICSGCGSLFIEEIPNNMGDWYDNYYSFSEPKKLSKQRKTKYKIALKNNKILSPLAIRFLKLERDLPLISLSKISPSKKAKILDVGCGSGDFLFLLKELGFENLTGIDPYLKKETSEEGNPQILKKDLYDIDEQYEIIMFHHVFEHFSEPEKALNHIKKILTTNGVCIIRMPDADSYSFRKYRDHWFSIHAPFHFILPSRKGFQHLLEKSGLYLESMYGEQLIDFFLYSKAHKLGVSDYSEHGNRKHIEKYGVRKTPPMHTKLELKESRQRLKQVKKHNLCDWSVFYIKNK